MTFKPKYYFKILLIILCFMTFFLNGCSYLELYLGKEKTSINQTEEPQAESKMSDSTEDNESLAKTYGNNVKELLTSLQQRDTQIDSLYTLLDYFYFKADSLSQELDYYSGRITVDGDFEVPRIFTFAGREFNLSNDRLYKEFRDIFYKEVKSAHQFIPKSGIYFPVFDSVFAKYDLPDDVKYLAIAESGLNSVATSQMGAGGIWQFMPATAKIYNMKVDNYVDERRDVFKATEAAAKYLTNSYRNFKSKDVDDWLLAICSYNAGEGAINRVMREQQAKDFFDLIMRVDETNEYVWRSAAIKLIFENEEKLFTTKFEREPSLYETTRVENLVLKGYYKLDDWAIAQGTVLRRVWELNPWIKLTRQQRQKKSAINNMVLPPGEYKILLPIDSEKNEESLATVEKVYLTKKSDYFTTHTVQKGDTLYGIAKKYGISVNDLKALNNIGSNTIQPGQQLKLVGQTTGGASTGGSVYVVKNGDTLDQIAKKVNVSVDHLLKKNNLSIVSKSGRKVVMIQPGDKIFY